MVKRILLMAMLVAALLAPAAAHAQTGGTTGSNPASLAASDFFIGLQAQQGTNLTDLDLLTYFNQANCECERDTWVFVALNSTGAAKRNFITQGHVQVWIGSGCDTATLSIRQTTCDLMPGGDTQLTEFAAQGGLSLKTNVRFLTQPHGTGIAGTVGTGGVSGAGGSGGAGGTVTSGDVCNQPTQAITPTIYVLVDLNMTGAVDIAASRQIPIDIVSPPVPGNVSAVGGNQALVAHWTDVDPAADASGILGYQILCDRANEAHVFDKAYKPSYETGATNCPDRIPGGNSVDSLDPLFVCSDLLSPATTSARIKILENGIYYGLRVLAIDKHRNPAASDKVFGLPVPSVDFYNVYRNDNPSALGQTTDPGHDSGGYCAAAPASAARGHGWMAIFSLTATAAVILAARRRRKRP